MIFTLNPLMLKRTDFQPITTLVSFDATTVPTTAYPSGITFINSVKVNTTANSLNDIDGNSSNITAQWLTADWVANNTQEANNITGDNSGAMSDYQLAHACQVSRSIVGGVTLRLTLPVGSFTIKAVSAMAKPFTDRIALLTLGSRTVEELNSVVSSDVPNTSGFIEWTNVVSTGTPIDLNFDVKDPGLFAYLNGLNITQIA